MLTAGLEKISDGTIGIHNRVINHLNENELASIRRQHIGIVFQSFYLIPSLSALENVLLALEANHKYGLEDHAKNLLEDSDYLTAFITYQVNYRVASNSV